VLAWLTIRSDVLERDAPAEPVHHYTQCPVSGPPVVDRTLSRAPETARVG
jgi:hypothetical protein